MTVKNNDIAAGTDATAKKPAKYFAAIPEKDAFRNFERGYLQSNHRKITECGLFGAPKRQVASFGSRIGMEKFCILLSFLHLYGLFST